MTDAELTVVLDHCSAVNAKLDLVGNDSAVLRVKVFEALMDRAIYDKEKEEDA